MQVRSLLSLFVDIETTDRSNAFYEKFNTRYKAGQILGACLCHARVLNVSLAAAWKPVGQRVHTALPQGLSICYVLPG